MLFWIVELFVRIHGAIWNLGPSELQAATAIVGNRKVVIFMLDGFRMLEEVE